MDIEVSNLVKSYNDKKAVDNISFSVKKGEIFCITGPNGSGKTSTIECIEGLRNYDSGNINVLGLDPIRDRSRLYEKIGVQIQEHSFVSEAKVSDLCKLYSSFYKNPLSYIDLLEEFNLSDSLDINAVDLSPGQKKKLSFIMALLPSPEIVFLDEITSFLDPVSKKDMLSYILNLKKKGITVLLINHYMDEVEILSDRVCIMENGKIIKIDTKDNIIKDEKLNANISFSVLENNFDINLFKNISLFSSVKFSNNTVFLKGKGDEFFEKTIHILNSNNIKHSNFTSSLPTLEDAYLNIIGYFNNIKGDEL